MTTETVETPTLGGLPIQGDISYYTEPDAAPQLGEDEFIARIKAVLDTGEIAAIGWAQYTPYFNDGDPCIFHIGEVYVFPKAERDPEVPRVVCGECGHQTDDIDYSEVEEGFAYHDETYDGVGALTTVGWRQEDDPRVSKATNDAVRVLLGNYSWRNTDAEARPGLQSGSFNQVCLKHFGDPALVVATSEGFTVEHYSHD